MNRDEILAACEKTFLDYFPGEYHEQFKREFDAIKADVKLGAVARKHWKVLLTSVKRWVLQLDLQNIKPLPGLNDAEKEFGDALKEAGL